MNFLSRLSADVALQVSEGRLKLIKGKLSPKKLGELTLLVSDLSLTKGEIWLDKRRKVTFSKEISEKYHQRFRNVLSL